MKRSPVDIWWVSPDRLADPELEAQCRLLLPVAERESAQRFHFARDRRVGHAARALVRTVLSRYRPVDPMDWRFRNNSYGRPEIAGPEVGAPIYFNLTHTDGFIACAVSRKPTVGIDAEDARNSRVPLEVADRFFSSSEVRDLRTLRRSAQRRRFFEIWTLKESYIKGRGMGLSLPLDGFSFHIDDAGSVRIRIDRALRDDGRRWQFALFRPTRRHVLACALRTGSDGLLDVNLSQWPGPGLELGYRRR